MYTGHIVKGYAWRHFRKLSFIDGDVRYNNGAWVRVDGTGQGLQGSFWRTISSDHPDYFKYVDVLKHGMEHKIKVVMIKDTNHKWRLI